ncbi:unnamed protein product [Thlaspi arvense]|uniref:Uncharacterized protein n=1 Tax=Thlaspi arvense TaxID=13288 RepID=A0AAU9SD97_THLAR|nr:unnamed protein product [Thlaspi arvense]
MEPLEAKGNTMRVEERLSLGSAILTEGIIIDGNPRYKVPRARLEKLLNFDTYSSSVWGKICPRTSEVFHVQNQPNILVNTIVGDLEEYQHLVPPPNPNDKDFEVVVQLVKQSYRLSRTDWINQRVDIIIASEKIGIQHARKAENKRTTGEAPLMTPCMTDNEKLDKIMKMFESLKSKMETLEDVLRIRAGRDVNSR